MTIAKRLAGVSICFLFTALANSSLAINPAGTSTNNQDYYDLANNTDDFLAVGQFRVGGVSCTATWLGGEYVLTARHCGGGPDSITFTFPNGLTVASVNHWVSNLPANVNDLAIVQLKEVPNVPANYIPGKIRPNNDGVTGQLGTLVGYSTIGRSAGHNTITAASNSGETQAIRSNASSFTLGAILNSGDSGGPIFVEEDDSSYSIVGVASVLFNGFDIWANPVAYNEQIEFGMQTNNFLFFQDGQQVPLIMGDTNQDLVVDQTDIQNLVSGWNQDHSGLDATQAWLKGDFNGNKTTDLSDVLVLHQALRAGGLSFPFEALASVPEPTTAATLILGLGVLSIRRIRFS